jgi:hypothetical protein
MNDRLLCYGRRPVADGAGLPIVEAGAAFARSVYAWAQDGPRRSPRAGFDRHKPIWD